MKMKEKIKQHWMQGEIEKFMLAFGQEVKYVPSVKDVSSSIRTLRLDLIREELLETIEATKNDDVVEFADGLADSLYVALGSGLSFGYNVDNGSDVVAGCVPKGMDVEYYLDSLKSHLENLAIAILWKSDLNCNRYLNKYFKVLTIICKVFEIPIAEIFKEVHASNMSKLGEDGKPIYREDGKVLKGPNFFKPDIKKFFPDRKSIKIS
jgi:predicted HAD superfamily Cof-like phosphohydrolase